MPLLERLEFYLGRISNINGSPAQRVNFPKLRYFHNYSDDYRFFDFMNADNLTDLVCYYFRCKERIIASHADKLISFLTRCKKLKSLGVSEHIFIQLFHLNEMPAIEFKLESFTLANHETSYDQNISFDRFEQFLISQAPTLTTLQFPHDGSQFTSNVFKTIFNRLTLKGFTIHGKALPVDQQFYDNLRPLESLRELTIYGPKSITVKKFLPKCPNIEILDMHKFNCNVLEHVARNNPKVSSLTIDAVRKIHPEGLQFNSLKEFKVEQIKQTRRDGYDFSHFLSVVKNCPEIETLDMSGYKIKINANVVGELMKQPKLKPLHICLELANIENLFSVIKEKCEAVEMLIDGQTGRSKRQRAVFKFPRHLNQ